MNDVNRSENPEELADTTGVLADMLRDPSTMPATVAQQLFSIAPGIAGGISGLILGARLANTRKVKTSSVLLSSGVVAVLTFASVYFIVSADEE